MSNDPHGQARGQSLTAWLSDLETGRRETGRHASSTQAERGSKHACITCCCAQLSLFCPCVHEAVGLRLALFMVVWVRLLPREPSPWSFHRRCGVYASRVRMSVRSATQSGNSWVEVVALLWQALCVQPGVPPPGFLVQGVCCHGLLPSLRRVSRAPPA